MRAERVGVAAAGLAVLVLAGCGPPSGVDGDLAGGWVEMPEPVGFVPAAETCHDSGFREVGAMSAYQPVPCGDEHRRETVHVGTFTGEAAERTEPPPHGTPELREAYRECDAGAADYLGADFRHGRFRIGVVLPRPVAWEGGARWFRCDLWVFRSHEDSRAERHTGSVRGALAESSELHLGCYAPEFDEEGLIAAMNPVECDEPHNAEFAGVWTAPDVSYMNLDNEDDANRIHRECRGVIADYVELPDDGDLQYRTGTIVTRLTEVDWEVGDRGFRCYLWLSDREVGESLAGAGTDGMPIRYG